MVTSIESWAPCVRLRSTGDGAGALAAGDLFYVEPRGIWIICCPDAHCGKLRWLYQHRLQIDDGSITLCPSILCACGAHYVVQNGSVEEVRSCTGTKSAISGMSSTAPAGTMNTETADSAVEERTS